MDRQDTDLVSIGTGGGGMSLTYACIYHENGLCRKDEEPGYVNYCAFGPCKGQTPSRGDRIRAMDDSELARYLFALVNSDFDPRFCQNKPECEALIDTDTGIPEENCILCLMEYLKGPDESDNCVRVDKTQ